MGNFQWKNLERSKVLFGIINQRTMKAKGKIKMWHENSHGTVMLTVFTEAHFICSCQFYSSG